MRVKITKTVDIDDLPGEVRRTVDGIKNRVMYNLPDLMAQVVKSSLSNQAEEYFSTIDLIDNFRQYLTSIDENLQEVNNIMQGHKNHLMPPQPEQPPNPPQTGEEEPDEKFDEEWAANEQAEYEKFMSQVMDAEDGHEPTENEEG